LKAPPDVKQAATAGANCVLASYAQPLEATYLAFAHRAFGRESYQALPEYVQWLYFQNPLSRGVEKDFAVLLSPDGQIVGCQHIMRLRWRLPDGSVTVIPAPHNTMVLPEYRGIAGGLLSARCYLGERHALVPGSQGRLSQGLRKSGFFPVPTWWFRKLLRPIAGGLRLAAVRVGYEPTLRPRWDAMERQLAATDEGSLWVSGKPRQTDWPVLLNLANAAAQGSLRLDWDEPLFRWRFFHDYGPRHHFVAWRRGDQLEGYALVSIGARKGLLMARVIDLKAGTARDCSELLRGAAVAAVAGGAHLLSMFCASPEVADWTRQAHWQAQSVTPDTYFFHRSKQAMPRYDFMSAAGDYGFEAICAAPTVAEKPRK